MRVTALVLGIIAAVLGIVASLIALSLGGIGRAVGAENGELIARLGWWSLFFDFLGFMGSGFALAKPRLAGVLLLVAGIGFFLSISWFAIISGPLFLIAGLFALMGGGRRRAGPQPGAAAD